MGFAHAQPVLRPKRKPALARGQVPFGRAAKALPRRAFLISGPVTAARGRVVGRRRRGGGHLVHPLAPFLAAILVRRRAYPPADGAAHNGPDRAADNTTSHRAADHAPGPVAAPGE